MEIVPALDERMALTGKIIGVYGGALQVARELVHMNGDHRVINTKFSEHVVPEYPIRIKIAPERAPAPLINEIVVDVRELVGGAF